LVGVFLRILPLWGNNFYFTVDQGRDAVYVREILHGATFTKGPETSIRGWFVGPGWYYLLAPGYFLAGGHPAGGVMTLIMINTLVMFLVARRWGVKVALALALFWPWFETSRYAFNPFLIAPLAIMLGLLLERGKKWWGLLVVLIAFNAHLFGAAVLLGTWLVGLVIRNMKWFMYAGILALGSGIGYLASPVWREWYVAFLWPVLLIMVASRLNKWLVGALVCIELVFFWPRYMDIWKTNDATILRNQLKVVDFVYKDKSGGYVYNYTDRFYDYAYQYLLWWKGEQLIGGVPCEYANFPQSNKALYVPGWNKYAKSQKGCDNKARYLIIESDTNGEQNSDWIEDFKLTTRLVDELDLGKVRVEKRLVTPLFQERYNEGLLWQEYVDNRLSIELPQGWSVEKVRKEEFEFANAAKSLVGFVRANGDKCELMLQMEEILGRSAGLLKRIMGSAKLGQAQCEIL
jgi:hypothetical protein